MRKPLFGTIVVVTAALAGLVALPTSMLAQEPLAPPSSRTIRVSGVGDVQAKPDQAHIDLAVEAAAATAQAAGEQNARTMERVISALVAAGVPRAEIETRNYSVYPEYAPPSPRDTIERQPRILGYRASNMVSVRTQDLTRVGRLIDAALGAGANRVDGVRFSLKDAEAPRAEAIGKAVQGARRSAEAIASALGVRLGPVLDASTSSNPVRPYPVAMMREVAASFADAPPTPIQPGEQTVMANVFLVFGIVEGPQ
jgi:uncharacterized protein YggE